MRTDTLSQAVVATPPASVAGLSLIGYPVAEWVSALMLIYALLLIVAQLPKAASAIRSIYRRLKNEQSNCR